MKGPFVLIAVILISLPAIGQPLPPHVLPDAHFTPGAVDPIVMQATIGDTICIPGFTKSIRPPRRYTSELKRAQLNDPSRHYDDRAMQDYEEDHLVPLEAAMIPYLTNRSE